MSRRTSRIILKKIYCSFSGKVIKNYTEQCRSSKKEINGLADRRAQNLDDGKSDEIGFSLSGDGGVAVSGLSRKGRVKTPRGDNE